MVSAARRIYLAGLPFDHLSTYMRGAGMAPALVREALRCDSSNSYSEKGVDIDEVLEDVGDSPSFENIGGFIEQLDSPVVSVGGDHAVTLPILRALGRKKPLSVLHFDAHPDMYDPSAGIVNPLGTNWKFGEKMPSHASPFFEALSEGLIKDLLQVGVRTMNGHQALNASRFPQVRIITMERFSQLWKECLIENWGSNSEVYISIDIDVLDPAYAPSVSHLEPGGLSTRELLTILQMMKFPNSKIVGADVVEYNPVREKRYKDSDQSPTQTAMVAAKLVKELVSKIFKTI